MKDVLQIRRSPVRLANEAEARECDAENDAEAEAKR